MSAHLLIPAYDKLPCTFSSYVITDILKKELNFDGLIITDALNMKALTNYFLADEVGMGNTIEAGVILRQFLLDNSSDPAYFGS